MLKRFVCFYSPGSFVSEESRIEIDSWNVEKAVALAKTIKERYGATPYGFQFITMGRTNKELDSSEKKRSNMYYLGGEVLTLQQVKNRKDKKDRILIRNMESNGYDKIIINTNSWKFTGFLDKKDVVLDFKK